MLQRLYTVYLLRSLKVPTQRYTGYTAMIVSERLAEHNAMHVTSTAPYVPWQLEMYLVFTDQEKALKFEKYLKSGSGIAFKNKRF